ncbi:molecular chaperone [Pseudoroseomonas cervicalis]|uniref:Cytoplasmic chaperone TorD n=1 Tax=Pseudoroseomonas cervicalis ATCC 49957 TaxID=525371 RepID=D5RTZ7_9PROT|nr:molecular chaperone TorD family protein [Pseudoroseomonas cervicalis]EFH09222.1 cytoplasmic chaperone TorD [Pseudoroseomonas cervicalis ATCC 49957]
MANPVPPAPELDLLELERARLFALLGRLMVAPPDGALLANLRGLQGQPDTLLGRAYAGLSQAARAAKPDAVEREYHALFIGVGRGELLPFASYYLTGFLHERPLAELRDTLARIGVERAPGVAEPEDHLGFLCETMAGLIAGVFPAGPEEAPAFFARHIQPWAGRCFADLEAAEAAEFYRAVGALGRAAVEVEAVAAGLPA